MSRISPVILPVMRAFDLFVPNLHHRALRDELFPMDEPARHHVHKEVAALIMRAFDRENPGSDVQDETVVTVRTERHGYVKKTPYIAGDLRAANLNELTIMTERFFNDPVVMSGTLEARPILVRIAPVTLPPPGGRQKSRRAKVGRAPPLLLLPRPLASLALTLWERSVVGQRPRGVGLRLGTLEARYPICGGSVWSRRMAKKRQRCG